MNECLTDMFLATINDSYKKSFSSNMVGRTDRTFVEIFQEFLNKYGKINPLDVEENFTRMKANWDPNDPIENLFSQINDASEFGVYAGHPVTDKDKVQAAEVLILKTGIFTQDYKDWRSHDDITRTWNFFQEFWQEQYNLKNETKTTAGSMGYGNSAQSAPAEDDEHYANAVTNFGEAFAANSSTIHNLTEANNTMVTNMSQLQEQLNSITMQLQQMAVGA